MVNEPVNDSPAGGIAARLVTFLALPMALFVAVMLDTFPETRCSATVVGVRSSEKSGPSP
jgi:hypothetical protein